MSTPPDDERFLLEGEEEREIENSGILGDNSSASATLEDNQDDEDNRPPITGKPRVNFDLDENKVYDDQDEYDSLHAEIGTVGKHHTRHSRSSRNRGNFPKKQRKLGLLFHTSELEDGTPTGNRRQKRGGAQLITKFLLMVMLPAAVLVTLFFVVSRASSPESSRNASPMAAPTGSSYPSGFNMKNNWGSYSPYFDTGSAFEGIDSEAELKANSHLTLKQVHILHRHGERYPTTGVGRSMSKVAEKLKAMTEPPAAELPWLDGWQYSLGTDLLVSRGVATEFQSGAEFWVSHGRYLYHAGEQLFYSPELNKFDNGTARPMPVLRATTQSRIDTSARAWAAGFFGVYGNQPYSPKDTSDLYDLVLQIEEPGINNTLASYYSCPNADKPGTRSGKEMQDNWVNTYLKTAAIRLQKLFPGFGNLSASDAYQMQNLCTLETAAYGTSGFCELFTETEWRGYEYSIDLAFYYDASFGTKVAAPEGLGWLEELTARLGNRYITDASNGVNVTLDNNPDTFPLEQPFYLDMSHDSVIVSVLTALGFDFLDKDLPANKIPAPRQFIVSRLTPFGARLFVEVLGYKAKHQDNEKLVVRLKLNNRILPLGSLNDCPASPDGLCPLDKFLSSVHHQLDTGDFDKLCYGPVADLTS
jgi:hypothetical protein